MSRHDATQSKGPLALETDVVVVGSGAGGAVVAATLAEAGQRVLVLEEGPNTSPQESGKLRPSQHLRKLWREAGLTFALGVGDSPAINIMMGKGVGGSSALTGGVCFRTPGWVLKSWREQRGLPMFTDAELEPYFEEVERAINVREVPPDEWSTSTKRFAEGAAKLGRPLKSIRRNTLGCEGFSKCNFGCPRQAKRGVDLNYLPRAEAAGAQVWTGCLVEKVTQEDGRATGVRGVIVDTTGRKVGRFTVTAKRVVLAAGAYHTPMILGASGVGRESEQVGKNMTLHPAFRVMGHFDDDISGWRGALQGAWTDAHEHERITLTAMYTPPGILAAAMPGVGGDLMARARQMPQVGIFGGMVHDEGGGTVYRGPGREPVATYQMDAKDKAAVPVLMRRMSENWFAAGAKKVYLPVLGLAPVTADQLASLDLEAIPGAKFECSSQHPLGTARMGSHASVSVIDSNCKAWELDELYLADGSVVPTSLGVNPQLTIMALALRTATHLRERPLRS